ncbi:uncharacterized protein [Epargyreus clarus]|uniref:uncharacterized protein isoform X1 n=1 Tax=Epargyreus clarus TaxID=520877 RepID=UPI003C2F44F8
MGTETNSKCIKRQRSENWLEEDKIILKELVKEKVTIIENKNTDSNTNAQKVAAWHDLRESFNNMARTPRTMQQIKAQWGMIKMSAKKAKFVERQQLLKTGGGPPTVPEAKTCEDISVWLPHEFTVDTNEFDSDYQNSPQNMRAPIKMPLLDNKEDSNEKNSPQNLKEPLIDNKEDSKEKVIIISDLEDNVSHSKPQQENYGNKRKNKKITNTTNNAAMKIAETEMMCRKELHEAQMANERQKLKNLILEEELLRSKIAFYKNNKKCD